MSSSMGLTVQWTTMANMHADGYTPPRDECRRNEAARRLFFLGRSLRISLLRLLPCIAVGISACGWRRVRRTFMEAETEETFRMDFGMEMHSWWRCIAVAYGDA